MFRVALQNDVTLSTVCVDDDDDGDVKRVVLHIEMLNWMSAVPEMYFALCELCAKCAKCGKVRNFEGHFAQSVESSQNGLKFWPHLEKFIRSLNMPSVLCSGA